MSICDYVSPDQAGFRITSEGELDTVSQYIP